ncbi:phosphatase PAP2 family protein [Vibrio agarivorans]|uniref:phosphatase PAP2 family protein n=1 Tax=Vibrio agarivorans TaxID=153622 RepID=UPI00222FEB84|nr:phosphatase PAP2 family protein [Vibrio agarivorans]MDN3660354.1 phosphatase PAP2 family protein [Vibrio agarivorans]
MKTKLKLLSPLLCIAALSPAFAGNNAINTSVNDEYVEAGDHLQILIPVTGLFAAWLHDDPQGAKQLALSVGATQVIVHGTKNIVGRSRPNDSSRMSFPSGHTAAAFSGAAFLQSRYGSAWGIPAYAAASFVGLSRMHGRRHHADDVLAAAGISFFVNQYLISPYASENMAFTAVPTKDGVSFGVSLANEFFSKQQRSAYEQRTSGPLNHRLELDIGFNSVDSLKKAGLPGDKLIDEAQPFASMTYTYQLQDDAFLEFTLSPNETRRYGQLTDSFEYNGKQYESGDDIYLAFRQWSVGGSYNQAFKLTDKLTASIGAGASGYLLELELDKQNGGQHTKTSSVSVLPGINTHLDYEVIDDLHTFANVQYHRLKSDSVLVAEAGVSYDLNKEWDISVKYQHQDSNWKSQQIDYTTKSVLLSIANRF